jgi:hypothetical protein
MLTKVVCARCDLAHQDGIWSPVKRVLELVAEVEAESAFARKGLIHFAFRRGVLKRVQQRVLEQGKYLAQWKDACVECRACGNSGAVEPAKLGWQSGTTERRAGALIQEQVILRQRLLVIVEERFMTGVGQKALKILRRAAERLE